MNILALETSGPWCSVALLLDGGCLEREIHARQTHSEIVLDLVDGLLAEAGLGLSGLGAIAFGQGPGSFTGLRIACAVAQGLAMGADLPVVAVGTLEALAADFDAERIIACIDARMNEVYLAAWAEGAEVLAPCLASPDAVPVPAGEAWLGVGSGFAAFGEILAGRFALARVVADAQPRAATVARLAAPRLAAGIVCRPEEALPIYIRDKVAATVAERQGG